MSRHCEKCCDILSDALLNLCRDNKKFSATETLIFKLSLKLIMSRQKEIMLQHNLVIMLRQRESMSRH